MRRSFLTTGTVVLAAAALGLVTGVLPAPSGLLGAQTTQSLTATPGAAVPTRSGSVSSPVAPTHSGRTPQEFAPGVVLVAPAAGADAEDLRPATRALEARPAGRVPGTRARKFELPRGVTVEQAVRRYERDPDVAYAEPDHLVAPTTPLTPNDTSYPDLWGLHNTGQTGGVDDADIDAPEAWGTTIGSASTVVAVIDTGTQISHPDLRGNVWTNTDEIPGNRVDDDRNGYVDDVHGWDFINDDATVHDGADDSHGTHVAGTIAAAGSNGEGVTGVAWRAQVMPLKFLGPDGGFVSDAASAIDYAVRNGATISNNSWGGSGYSQTLRDAIGRAASAGHLFVAAAGNDGRDLESAPSYPAAYTNSNIVSVAATDHADRLATFSNYGSTSVDLAAPGVQILSTLPRDTYGRYSGTSMATPHVTGVAALLRSAEPGLGLAVLRQRLLESVDQLANLRSKVATGGRLNAARALQVVDAGPEVVIDASPSTLVSGSATSLYGDVTVDGSPRPGQEVELQQRPVGASSWSGVTQEVTDTEGRYSVTGVRPEESTDFRVLVVGADPAASQPLRVSVRARVSLVASEKSLALGRSRVLRGTVRPPHADSVRIVVRRNGVKIRTVTRPLVDSAYRWGYTPPRRGRYTFVTVWRADADHLGARSPQRSFRVR